MPLLAKLGNLVPDGGIWMNTQRPEWNDANNALVGYGLSMVTLCYLRRYVGFLQRTAGGRSRARSDLSAEVSRWLAETAAALGKSSPAAGQRADRAPAALRVAGGARAGGESLSRDRLRAGVFAGDRSAGPGTGHR